MKKKAENLKEELLNNAKVLILDSGIKNFNLRKLAQKSDVAVGTIYNYFTDKTNILTELTSTYWEEKLKDLPNSINNKKVIEQVESMYSFLLDNLSEYIITLMSALNTENQGSHPKMQLMQQQFTQILLSSLQQDTTVCKALWNTSFSQENFAEFIIQNLFLSLRQKDPDVLLLLKIIEYTIY